MSNRFRSRSAISFEELKNKTDEIYEFGNDWGLYVDIETNYHNNFKQQKIKTSNYSLFKIFEANEKYCEEEYDLHNAKNENNREEKINYFKNGKLFLKNILVYLCVVLGINYYFGAK